jgi:hypothetical protein
VSNRTKHFGKKVAIRIEAVAMRRKRIKAVAKKTIEGPTKAVVVAFRMQREVEMQDVAVDQRQGVRRDEGLDVDEEKDGVELVQLLANPTATEMPPMARLPRRVMPTVRTARRLTDRIQNKRHDSWRIDVTSRNGLRQNGVDS